MKLIDADRLNVAIEKLESDLEEEYSVPSYGALKSLIDEQPAVYPIFSARTSGKTILREYCAIREILENYGLDSTDPVETLNFVLNQYQRIIADLTGGFFSKLSYEADVIIAKVCDRLTDEDDSRYVEACDKMREALELSKSDPERAHAKADDTLRDYLVELGKEELISLYDEVEKW